MAAASNSFLVMETRQMSSALVAGLGFALIVLGGLAFIGLLADYALIAGASILFVALTALPYEIARSRKKP